MFTLVFWGLLLGLSAGLAIKFLLPKLQSNYSLSWKYFAVGAAVISLLVVPGVSWAGQEIAKSNQVNGFHEYWSGYELEANWVKTNCYRDGPCLREYDCDSYPCNPHPCNCVCTSRDESGSCTSETCQTCWDTCWHDCPYCTEEWTFTVDTTIGNVIIDSHRFPDDPQSHRWRNGVSVPDYVIDHAGVGVPEFWKQVAERIKQGKPGPVTMVKNYVNYILASQDTILDRYSGDIDQYRKEGLLPVLSYNVKDYYYADKVYPVGFRTDKDTWQKAAMRFNAALGSDLQGDLHLVIVNDDRVTNPDEYLGTLMAYWLGPELGKKALSKNGIVVVLGTEDGRTVEWARAQTGMPVGNEALLQEIRSTLPETELTPEKILGTPRGELMTKDGKKYVRVIHDESSLGALEKIVWGENKFHRECMTCKEERGVGFTYLSDEIQPTGGQKTGIVLVAFLICLLIWTGLVFLQSYLRTSIPNHHHYRR